MCLYANVMWIGYYNNDMINKFMYVLVGKFYVIEYLTIKW